MLQNKLDADLKRFIDIPDNRTESGKILLNTIVQCIHELYFMILQINPMALMGLHSPIPNQPELPVIFQHIVKLPELPPEEFISISEFIENFRLIENGKRIKLATDSSVSSALREDEDLVKYAGDRGPSGNRWFIKPMHFIHYVARSKLTPRLRTRCKEYLKQQEKDLA